MVANPMKQWLMHWQRSPALLFYLIFLLVVSVAPVCCAAIGTQDSQTAAGRIADSPLNASYQIEGQWITLNNGRAQQPAAPGSASTIRTEVAGRWVNGDLEGDGRADVVVGANNGLHLIRDNPIPGTSGLASLRRLAADGYSIVVF